MIDLQPFCASDVDAGFNGAFLKQPFSIGAYTFATNLHIAIRVPRRMDVPENPEAPKLNNLFDDTPYVSWRPLRAISTPQEFKERCPDCSGRGTEHDCPGCTCLCNRCGSSGLVMADASINMGGAVFNLRYVQLLAALPGILVPEEIATISPIEPMPFKFDGGDGLLMAMRCEYSHHIETPT